MFEVIHDLENRIPTNEQQVASVGLQLEHLQKSAPSGCPYFVLFSFVSPGCRLLFSRRLKATEGAKEESAERELTERIAAANGAAILPLLGPSGIDAFLDLLL